MEITSNAYLLLTSFVSYEILKGVSVLSGSYKSTGSTGKDFVGSRLGIAVALSATTDFSLEVRSQSINGNYIGSSTDSKFSGTGSDNGLFSYQLNAPRGYFAFFNNGSSEITIETISITEYLFG